jgi:hypothetical protein
MPPTTKVRNAKMKKIYLISTALVGILTVGNSCQATQICDGNNKDFTYNTKQLPAIVAALKKCSDSFKAPYGQYQPLMKAMKDAMVDCNALDQEQKGKIPAQGASGSCKDSLKKATDIMKTYKSGKTMPRPSTSISKGQPTKK